MGRIQFWLAQGNERLRLPVNPSSVSVSTSHGYEDISVSQLGEYTVIGERELDRFEFSSFFPREYNPSYCEYENVPKPWDAVQTIEKWRDARRPARLTVTGTPINTLVTIRDFNYDAERAGSVGDIFFSIELKQYVPVEVKRVEIAKPRISSASKRPDPKPKPKTYTVKKGDSLWKIAQRFLGNGNRWREIYNIPQNKKTIGKNPNLIYPGQVLVIPT